MPTPLWSLPIDAMPRGISLAREAQRLLVWTETNWLFWISRKGERQAQSHLPSPIAGAAVSEDGSAFVVAETDGRFSWLAPDLRPRWDRLIKGKPTAVAIDPLGLVAAVATSQPALHLLYADGEIAREVSCPRPAHHLAFVPGTARLCVAADLGWVGAFDLEIGDWIWRDAPVLSFGGMAVAGKGEPILLACYSEGLRGFHADGKPWRFDDAPPPARSICISYDASRLVTLHMDSSISGLSLDFKPQFSYRPEGPVAGMALGALGETLWLAQADRRIVALDLK